MLKYTPSTGIREDEVVADEVVDLTRCPFCQIVKRNDKRVILADYYRTVIFEPLGPIVPGHVLAVPKIHTKDAAYDPSTTGETFEMAARYGRRNYDAFNLITSSGSAATQTHAPPRPYRAAYRGRWSDAAVD